MRTLAIVGISIVLSAGICWLTPRPVPFRDFATQAWTKTENYSAFEDSGQIEALVGKVKRDYFLFPIPKCRGEVILLRAYKVPPDDIYLLFSVGIPDITIVYRCGLNDQRLYWKARVSG